MLQLEGKFTKYQDLLLHLLFKYSSKFSNNNIIPRSYYTIEDIVVRKLLKNVVAFCRARTQGSNPLQCARVLFRPTMKESEKKYREQQQQQHPSLNVLVQVLEFTLGPNLISVNIDNIDIGMR